jgi:hypothetical protein
MPAATIAIALRTTRLVSVRDLMALAAGLMRQMKLAADAIQGRRQERYAGGCEDVYWTCPCDASRKGDRGAEFSASEAG